MMHGRTAELRGRRAFLGVAVVHHASFFGDSWSRVASSICSG